MSEVKLHPSLGIIAPKVAHPSLEVTESIVSLPTQPKPNSLENPLVAKLGELNNYLKEYMQTHEQQEILPLFLEIRRRLDAITVNSELEHEVLLKLKRVLEAT